MRTSLLDEKFVAAGPSVGLGRDAYASGMLGDRSRLGLLVDYSNFFVFRPLS
jgi:hypothetical protein